MSAIATRDRATVAEQAVPCSVDLAAGEASTESAGEIAEDASLQSSRESEPARTPKRLKGGLQKANKRAGRLIAALAVVCGITGYSLSTLLSPGSPRNYVSGTPTTPQECSAVAPHQVTPDSQAVMSVNLFVRSGDGQCWSPYLSPVTPGSTIKFLMMYQNISNREESNVTFRFTLPPHMKLVPNSTFIANGSYPSGKEITCDCIDGGGVVFGNYFPKATAYVLITVAVQHDVSLQCGKTTTSTVGVVKAAGTNEFYNTADADFYRIC